MFCAQNSSAFSFCITGDLFHSNYVPTTVPATKFDISKPQYTTLSHFPSRCRLNGQWADRQTQPPHTTSPKQHTNLFIDIGLFFFSFHKGASSTLLFLSPLLDARRSRDSTTALRDAAAAQLLDLTSIIGTTHSTSTRNNQTNATLGFHRRHNHPGLPPRPRFHSPYR